MIFVALLLLMQAPAGRVLKANPSSQEGWWSLGTLYYQQDRYPECRDAFKQLSKLAPKGGPAWTMLGLCEFGAKQFDAALIHLRQGQDLRVGYDGIDTVAKFHLAELYTHAGNVAPASRSAQRHRHGIPAPRRLCKGLAVRPQMRRVLSRCAGVSCDPGADAGRERRFERGRA